MATNNHPNRSGKSETTKAAALRSALDFATETAQQDPEKGVARVVALLDNAHKTGYSVQAIMDGAVQRGFGCQFWPTGIRVEWRHQNTANSKRGAMPSKTSQLAINAKAAEAAIRAGGGQLLAEWPSRVAGRLCIWDLFMLRGEVIVIQRLYDGKNAGCELQHFDVFRCMGRDNKMETLMAEIAAVGKE